MSKFLKLAIVPLAFLLAGTATSCTVSPKEIALITDVGDIDDGSFNQESWEAVKEYANEYHKSYDFYRPFNDSDFARSCAIKQAVAKGAQVIVLPGFKFATTCTTEHSKYPNVHFLLIDSSIEQDAEHSADNVCCVGFKCEYSGFAAGYTIATDLMMRDLEDNGSLQDKYGYGYCGGMASNGVLEFGYGFIQGICKATADMCEANNIPLKKDQVPQININYNYAMVFAQDDNATARMKGWLSDDKKGIKVLFPCGGKLYQSATEAVQYYNKHNLKNYDAWLRGEEKIAPRQAARWVGVDSDQYRGLKYDYELKSIYTSALKGLKNAIMHTLDFHYQDEWSLIGGYREKSEHLPIGGGQIGLNGQWILGLHSSFGEYAGAQENADNYVGIPTDDYNEKTGVIRGFEKYTVDQADNLLLRLAGGTTTGGPIPVYGGDGTDLGKQQGIPTDMPNWEVTDPQTGTKTTFDKVYLGSYPVEKIDVNYI